MHYAKPWLPSTIAMRNGGFRCFFAVGTLSDHFVSKYKSPKTENDVTMPWNSETS